MRSQDQIFMIEAFITKITFDADFEITKPNDLSVNFSFSDICNFDVQPHTLKVTLEKGTTGNAVIFNMGKSFLFNWDVNLLKKQLKVEPLEVVLLLGNDHIGVSKIPFKQEFSEMINFFTTLGIVKSCSMQNQYKLKNDNQKDFAIIDLTVRMSCFGSNIQTHFYLRETSNKEQEYIFRYKNTGQFIKCKRTPEDAFIPISPLYGIAGNPSLTDSDVNVAQNISLTSLYDSTKVGGKEDSRGPKKDDFDVLSICFRPSENKFFDLLHLISADVKQTEGGPTCIKIKTTKDFNKDLENFMSNITSPRPVELTQERIEKMLCHKKDCPAAKKFKEYGIGPLATGKALGTLYNYVEPPVVYGLSHTYGTLDNYGPYGLFTKPKRPEDDFVPPANISELHLGPCRTKVHNKKNRRQVPVETCPADSIKSDSKIEKRTCKHQQLLEMQHSKCCPLRLKGGDVQTEIVLRLRGGTAELELEHPKSPEVECKDVMDQLDDILNSYKRAIGPCGQATCPYAQNFAEENCKKACEGPLNISDDKSISCDSIPCTIPTCPYMEPIRKAFPAGCGNPKCAYTKYKLGLVDDDAALELLYLPPAISGKCGHPKCKYPLEPELPPIHWDCPEPLPKGPCKNLNCPLLPPELRRFKTKEPKPTGPCGSPKCPYALPEPCENPTCPFKQNPCPFFKDRNNNVNKIGAATCANADCPYNKTQNDIENDPKYKGDIIQDSDSIICAKRKKEDVCENPGCPHSGTGDKPSESDEEVCSNPDCPLSKGKVKKSLNKKRHSKDFKSDDDLCGNPTCPFAKIKVEKEAKRKSKRQKKYKEKQSFCDNPDCQVKEQVSICSNPDCPFIQKEKNRASGDNESRRSVCSNPDCPFSKRKKRSKLCSNPNCPDRDQISSENSTSNASCDNPDCPLKKKSKNKKEKCASSSSDTVCDNPSCPYAEKKKSPICEDPICPYLQPLPSCGIPNCPFEPPCGIVIATRPWPASTEKKPKPKTCKHMNQLKQKRSPCSRPDIGSPKNSKTNDVEEPPTETVEEQDKNIITYEQEVIQNANGDTVVKTSIKREEQVGNPAAEGVQTKVKKKKRGKFVYTVGDKYPGLKVGHKECVMPYFHVPANMGWLWNLYTPVMNMKPRRGWRPGALTKTIARMIRAHRQAKGLGMLRVPKFRKDGLEIDEDDINVKPKPTLTIQKKEGAYWVTVNPLKDPYTLAENENPYMDCTPMTFKITKNKKKIENYCCCDGEEVEETIPLSDTSSNSELDIEFTPPAGIIHPARFKKKRNVIHCDTQYDPKDFVIAKKKGKDKKGKGKDKGKKGKGGKKKGKK